MNKKLYTQQVEQLYPHDSFEQETKALLAAEAARISKEDKMRINRNMKIIIAAAVFALLLTSTVFAAAILLSPSEVASEFGETELSKAFESEDAVIVNETKQAGEYNVSFLGMVNGDFSGMGETYTYAVFAVEYTDGRAMDVLDGCPVSITPLIDGYQPWCVNLFSLSNGANAFVQDNVYYYLFSCNDLELFADHDIRLYVYEGHAPGSEIFSYDQSSGKIDYAAEYGGIRAVFELDLDESKADPQAVKKLLESAGFDVGEDGRLILE